MTGIEVLVGAVMPVLIELVARYIKSTNGKFIVSLVLPLLSGVAINYNSLTWADADAVFASAAVVFASAQTVYKLYFRDSGLQKRLNG